MTTHSKFFLEFILPYELIYFKKIMGETKVYKIEENEKLLIDIFKKEISEKGNGDIFFSDFVILVEGKYDKIILNLK